MKPGDLRQFKTKLDGSAATRRVAGQPFMVLEVQGSAASPGSVNFLIASGRERGWGYDWVKLNSDPI